MGAKVYSTIIQDSSGKKKVLTKREAGLPSGYQEDAKGVVTKKPTVLSQPGDQTVTIGGKKYLAKAGAKVQEGLAIYADGKKYRVDASGGVVDDATRQPIKIGPQPDPGPVTSPKKLASFNLATKNPTQYLKKETTDIKEIPAEKLEPPIGKGGSTEFRKAAGLDRTIQSTVKDIQRLAGTEAGANPKEKAKMLAKNVWDLVSQKEQQEKFKEAGVELQQGTLPIGPKSPGGAIKTVKDAVKGIKIAFGKGSKSATTATKTKELVGKPAISLKDKFPGLGIKIGKQYATNSKTIGLTKGFFLKLGLTIGGVSLLKDAIGTYPYAGFIKEEALQTLDFATRTAQQNEDPEALESALALKAEILNQAPNIIDKIPYANVQKQLKNYFLAAAEKLEIDEKGLEKMRKELTGELENKYDKSARESRERELSEREEDEEYFDKIAKDKAEDKEEERDKDEDYYDKQEEDKRKMDLEERKADEEYYEKQAADKKQEDIDEMTWKAEYYALLRDGKYEEAEELLQAQMKGGS